MATNVGLVGSVSDSRKRAHRDIDYLARRKMHQERLERLGKNQETRAELVERVRARLRDERDASDLLMSLFLTALFSYRRAEICSPFPDDFFKPDGEKDFETVEFYAKALPDVQHLSAAPEQVANLPLPPLRLLSWAVDTALFDGFRLQRIPLDQYKREVQRFAAKQNHAADPTFVFRLDYDPEHPRARAFERLKEKHETMLGFHGSPFENFHSILRNGLDATYGKETSLFGDGIYLSEDQDVAVAFLKPGKNMAPKSSLGAEVSCLVCAEVAKLPSAVRTSKHAVPGLTFDAKLPKGYIVSEENDCVLIRYLLVYQHQARPRQRINFCWILALVYVFLMCALWMSRLPTVKWWLNQYL